MKPERRLLLAHCAAYSLSILGGLAVVVPLALNGSHFKGRCLLFSRGFWRTENRSGAFLGRGADPGVEAGLWGWPGAVSEAGAAGGSVSVSRLVMEEWGPPAACQLPAFVGVFTVLFGAAQSWRSLFYLQQRHDDTLLFSSLTLLLSVSLLCLSLLSSATLSLGFLYWCDTVTDHQTVAFSCPEAQAVPLYLDVDTSAFYSELTWAQAGLWSVTVLWLCVSVLSLLRVCLSQRGLHRGGACLARDKELLLGVGSDPQPTHTHIQTHTHLHTPGHFV
ncbi:transmembrane protein 179 [Amia ocellicauda]|uniref:transmembrane protein 179 n=1 Tax=Amia ocellicauda TaxID=2972642 RepID=UPI0034648FE7